MKDIHILIHKCIPLLSVIKKSYKKLTKHIQILSKHDSLSYVY